MVGLSASSGSSASASYTAMAIGGLLLAALGFLNRLAALRRFFTVRIVAVILILIAFTLSPVIMRLILGDSSSGPSLILALLFVLGLIGLNEILAGALKSLTLPIGIVLGSLLYWLWRGGGEAPLEAAGAAASSGWLISPVFEAGPVLAFLFCFLALAINELGSVEAVGRILGASDMDGRVRRGVGVAGLGSATSGLLGVIGPVDYSMSAGLIAATGCAARLTLAPAGVALSACALFPSFIELLTAIPKPVMGAALLYTMVSQLASGLSMLVAQKAVSTFSQGVVVGFPLMAALAVSFSPTGAMSAFPSLLRPVIGNGFVIGTLAVVFLEHVMLRSQNPSG
jgi:xanthine/uracil permease